MKVKLTLDSEGWKDEFKKTKTEISAILSEWSVTIEHIGSTSVQDLMSKPILDVGIGVGAKDDIGEMVKLLLQYGYVDHGDRKERGGYLMVKFSGPQVISHHVHILRRGDEQWKNYLHFRDVLRMDPIRLAEYQRLKKQLAEKYAEERGKYTEGKRAFIQSVLTSDHPSGLAIHNQ